jgi:excisionase family DNA binding protein
MPTNTQELKLAERAANTVSHELTAFLTYKEFAYESRLSPSTVRKRVRCGDLRAVHLGRSVRIPRSELDRLSRQSEAQ